MSDRATVREVARLAGVHPGTVSRALNPESRFLVNADTARRVDQAAKELDYQPNLSARSLKTSRSRTIGILVPDLTNPLFPPIVRGIEDRLAAAGYVGLIGNTDNDDDRERLIFDRMRSRHVDGFILATARRANPLPVTSSSAGVPLVLVNRISDCGAISSVSVDDSAGMQMSVGHLVKLGHKHIGHIGGPQALSTGYDRYLGFIASMRESNVDLDPDLVVMADMFSEAEGYRCARTLLGRGAPTGLVVANDTLALGVLRAMEEMGWRCPGDISVVGFNDMAFIDRITPPLTTVHIPKYELGHEAAQLMLESLAPQPGAVRTVLLAPKLVIRGSSRRYVPSEVRTTRGR